MSPGHAISLILSFPVKISIFLSKCSNCFFGDKSLTVRNKSKQDHIVVEMLILFTYLY